MTSLEDLGYNSFFEECRIASHLENSAIGRVVSEHRELYRVRDLEGEYAAKVTGKLMYSASGRVDYPAVGDWVAFEKTGPDSVSIIGILDRKTKLSRKYSGKDDEQLIATNIDVAFIVESINRDFSLNRFERYVVLARDGGVQPILVINKTDLATTDELQKALDLIANRFEDIPVVTTSSVAEDGINALSKHLHKGKTYCFLGSSGVGKSTLINRLLEQEAIRTQDIGVTTDRGKHTTTSREMYFLNDGGIVIDNPGTREVGLTDSFEAIDEVFDDVDALARQCKFTDCTHTHEQGCAIQEALRANQLNPQRFENYQKLTKEAQHYEMTEHERRSKGKQFGKMVKQVKKSYKGYKDY